MHWCSTINHNWWPFNLFISALKTILSSLQHRHCVYRHKKDKSSHVVFFVRSIYFCLLSALWKTYNARWQMQTNYKVSFYYRLALAHCEFQCLHVKTSQRNLVIPTSQELSFHCCFKNQGEVKCDAYISTAFIGLYFVSFLFFVLNVQI